MPKSYWIAHVDLFDTENYPAYLTASTKAVTSQGGRFQVRGGKCEQPEGQLKARHVLVEFPSYEAALACYRSEEYQAALRLRERCARSDMIIVEGCEHN